MTKWHGRIARTLVNKCMLFTVLNQGREMRQLNWSHLWRKAFLEERLQCHLPNTELGMTGIIFTNLFLQLALIPSCSAKPNIQFYPHPLSFSSRSCKLWQQAISRFFSCPSYMSFQNIISYWLKGCLLQTASVLV